MTAILRYGNDSSIEFDLPEGQLLAQCGRSGGQPVADVGWAVSQALAEPLDYPPLVQGTTPTDRVVLALDHGVPQAPAIVATVVQTLVRGGVSPDGITLVRTHADVESGAPDPRGGLPEELRPRVTLETHQPDDRGRVAYLAASESGEAIVLNRTIVDADVLVPIGAITSRRAADYHGIFGTVFPAFSDQRTIARFRSPALLRNGAAEKKRLLKECNEVGWLLGVNFTLQVVPGPQGGVLHVVAGQVAAVRRHGRELYEEAWGCSVHGRASLVVAAIEGGPEQQTWHHLGQALASATSLVEHGGAIAVCCDLAADPGPAVRHLAASRSREAALRLVRREMPEDALVASQLARALDRAHVYLLSRLDESLLEELEIARLAGPEEVVRLAHRRSSCILLSNASYVLVKREENGE